MAYFVDPEFGRRKYISCEYINKYTIKNHFVNDVSTFIVIVLEEAIM